MPTILQQEYVRSFVEFCKTKQVYHVFDCIKEHKVAIFLVDLFVIKLSGTSNYL